MKIIVVYSAVLQRHSHSATGLILNIFICGAAQFDIDIDVLFQDLDVYKIGNGNNKTVDLKSHCTSFFIFKLCLEVGIPHNICILLQIS